MSNDTSHRQIGKSVGAKLRAARLVRKLTQSELARPNFSVSYISAIERGQIQPSLRALEILAHRLGLSSTQLLPSGEVKDDTPLELNSSPIRDEEAIEFALLEAQIYILQNTPQLAIEHLENLVSKVLKRPQQTHLRYLLGWSYFQSGRLQESEHALSEAVKLAKNQGDSYLNLQIYDLFGQVSAAINNPLQALQFHRYCLKQLERMQLVDPVFKCQIYNRLGQLYSHLKDLPMAIEMFQQALSLIKEFMTSDQLKTSYWTIFQYHIHAKEYHLARLYAYKCLHLYTNETINSLRSQLYHYLGRALMKSDQEKAHSYLVQALEQENMTGDRLAQASILAYLAQWFLEHKALKEAEEHALKAQTLAQPFGATVIAAQSLLLLGYIAYAQHRHETGDHYFKAGLALLEHLGIEEDLAEHYGRYAQLLEENGRMRDALLYLKLAFQQSQKGT